MSAFTYRDHQLSCDTVGLSALAEAAGTPCYVYSAAAIAARYRAIDAAFGAYPHALHYALKANSTLAIARLLRELGSAADANSGGEIEVARRAGFTPDAIVFTGVGKTREELELAVALGVKTINAESAGELERIDQVARGLGTQARVALRVNPDIDALSHPHISTGLGRNKFGVPLGDAPAILRDAAGYAGIRVVALHLHVGSQMMSLEPVRRAAGAAAALARELHASGVPIEYLDLGGGLGISYDGRPAPTFEDYAAAILDGVQSSGLPLVIEPGRAIVGPAGALVARVVDVKPQPGDKHFVVLDAGMTELLRPALYGAFHRIVPVREGTVGEVAVDIVGPLCESSDTLGADRRLPLPRVGDLLAVLDAGAYGSAMAFNYNRRLLPPETLVENGAWRLIRRRQTIDDMLALECS
ncbi:MAG: diaminopimelate decarboxylase [Vicinamibacterales bacterium]